MPNLQPALPKNDGPQAFKEKLLMRVFLHGHTHGEMPRWFRRAFARSDIHRAWLVGHDGCFWQDGMRFGPANPYGVYLERIKVELDEMMGVDEHFPELGEP